MAAACNSLSAVVLFYFLYERGRAGSTPVYHILRPLERFLPPWVRERRRAAEKRSIAQLMTTSIAATYLIVAIPQLAGPSPFDEREVCEGLGALSQHVRRAGMSLMDRRRGRDADISLMNRGDAAAATRIVRGDESRRRPRRG